MFALTNLNDIQTHMLRLVIYSDSIGKAWNNIVSSRPRYIGAIGGGSRSLEYILFELNNPNVLDLKNEGTDSIKFTINTVSDDMSYSIKVKNCFKEFCLKTFSTLKYVWSNSEFADHYHSLRDYFSQCNLTDDTPTMWNIHIIPIDCDKSHTNIGFLWNPKDFILTIKTTNAPLLKRQTNSWIISQTSIKCDTLINQVCYNGFVAL
jgi:hypothetical protein